MVIFKRPEMEVKIDSEILFQIFKKIYKIDRSEIQGHSRLMRLVFFRNAFIYVMRNKLNHNLYQIAEILNNRDHATIIHALKMVENNYEYNYHSSVSRNVFDFPKENYKNLISLVCANYEEIEHDFKELENLFV